MTKKKKPVGVSLYPWEEWMSKKKLSLKQGKDFQCQMHTMIQQVRNRACEYGLSVSTQVSGDTLQVSLSGHRWE